MIAKMVKGKGFRGTLEYDLRQSKGYVLDSNMAGSTARELAREFGQVRALRPNLSRAVCHVSLALAPGESLSDAQWKEVAQKYLNTWASRKISLSPPGTRTRRTSTFICS